MSSILTSVGLGHSSPLHTSGFLMWNWFYAYAVLSSRHMKQYYGLDHNVSPREDLVKYGERAVQDGKISRQALGRMRRIESAGQNSTEAYTLFAGSVLFGMITKLPNETINLCCLNYTLARLVYGPAYVLVETRNGSLFRSLAWWWANISCLTLLWKGGNVLLAES